MGTQRKVFISSTVNELQSERNILADCIMKLSNKYITFVPLRSEVPFSFVFTDTDYKGNDSVEICLENVQKSHFYVLLLKNEYNGTKTSPSTTEKEYNVAKKCRIPTIVFIWNDCKNRTDLLKNFVSKVEKEKWCYFISDTNEICDILSEFLLKYDASKFVSEYPADGILCRVGETFSKRWTIKNSGNVIWENRKMKQSSAKNDFMPTKEWFSIPKILPGEEYTLKVKYKCKNEGVYYSCWKMYDEHNREIYPQYRGLWVDIRASE